MDFIFMREKFLQRWQYYKKDENYPHSKIVRYSNMTWFFSPIKSTDTNTSLFPDKAVLAVSQAFPS